MFEVEIKNLKVLANIGITPEERKKKQLLKVTLNFSYNVQKNKNLEKMLNLKDYSGITKSLKKFINESQYNTLEKLIISSSQMIEKKFMIKKVKIKINKTAVAKRYGSETVSVSN
jgi:FolB domain-containing protein